MVTYLYAEFYSNNNSYCDFKASVSEDLKRYANIDTNEVYTSLDIGSLGYKYSNSKITSSAGANNTTVKTITFKYIRTRFTIVLYVNGGREGSYNGYMDEDDRVRYVIEPKRLFLGLGYDCINDASKNPSEKDHGVKCIILAPITMVITNTKNDKKLIDIIEIVKVYYVHIRGGRRHGINLRKDTDSV